ncbi:MAG: DUF2931 family protein [Chitinophagaceae bacterium]
MMKFAFLVALMVSLVHTKGCSDVETAHEWYPTAAAPALYPVEIISGKFILADSSIIGMPILSYLSDNWGKVGAIDLVGEERKAIPFTLNIKWLEFRERAFYEGNFDLHQIPFDKIISDGFINPENGEIAHYDYFIAGLAPGGGVSLWLEGHGVSIEVGHFYAKKVEIDLKDFLGSSPNLETYIKDALAGKFSDSEISRKLTPQEIQKWSVQFRELYEYRPIIVTTATEAVLDVKYFNGAKSYDGHAMTLKPISKQALPLKWSFNVGTGDAQRAYEVTFDEQGIFAAANKISDNNTQPFDIQIEVVTATHDISVFLKNKQQFIELKKCVFNKYLKD